MSTLVPTCDQVTREARPQDISHVILYQFMLPQVICARLVQCHQHSPVCGLMGIMDTYNALLDHLKEVIPYLGYSDQSGCSICGI